MRKSGCGMRISVRICRVVCVTAVFTGCGGSCAILSCARTAPSIAFPKA